MGAYTYDVGHPHLSGAQIATFHNNYPTFDDTNNLSLVTFLHYHDIHIVFSGGLKKAGLATIARQPVVPRASEQGKLLRGTPPRRESGYLADICEYCQPAIGIVSDGPIRYETQNTDYGRHVSGIP